MIQLLIDTAVVVGVFSCHTEEVNIFGKGPGVQSMRSRILVEVALLRWVSDVVEFSARVLGAVAVKIKNK